MNSWKKCLHELLRSRVKYELGENKQKNKASLHDFDQYSSHDSKFSWPSERERAQLGKTGQEKNIMLYGAVEFLGHVFELNVFDVLLH